MVRFTLVALAAVPMCHPSVIRCRKLMRHDEGNTLRSQDHREELRALPRNRVECGMAYSPMRQASCPSRWLSLVCKRPRELFGLSKTNTIGYYEDVLQRVLKDRDPVPDRAPQRP